RAARNVRARGCIAPRAAVAVRGQRLVIAPALLLVVVDHAAERVTAGPERPLLRDAAAVRRRLRASSCFLTPVSHQKRSVDKMPGFPILLHSLGLHPSQVNFITIQRLICPLSPASAGARIVNDQKTASPASGCRRGGFLARRHGHP